MKGKEAIKVMRFQMGPHRARVNVVYDPCANALPEASI